MTEILFARLDEIVELDATNVSFTPGAGISSNTVNSALLELGTEKANIADLAPIAFSGSGSDIDGGNATLTTLTMTGQFNAIGANTIAYQTPGAGFFYSTPLVPNGFFIGSENENLRIFSTLQGNVFSMDHASGLAAFSKGLVISGSALTVSSGTMTITGGTLAPDASALTLTATQPAVPTTTQNAININVTSAGSASFGNRAMSVVYLAGYTGSSTTTGIFANNTVGGTANTLIPVAGTNTVAGNLGISGNSNGSNTGLNVGLNGQGGSGTVNVGTTGISQLAKNGATNIGGAFSAINTGTSPVQVGIWASLNRTTLPTDSAAAIFDNGSQTDPIVRFRDNGIDVMTIFDGGTITMNTAATQSIRTISRVGIMRTDAVTVDFSLANTDWAITIPPLPINLTRIMGWRVKIFAASASLVAGNYGVFPTTAGGGTALIAAGSGITVSSAADAAANNAQSVATTQLTTYLVASLTTPNTVYFRTGTAAAGTAKVMLEFYPVD